jgi:hypothetical protein
VLLAHADLCPGVTLCAAGHSGMGGPQRARSSGRSCGLPSARAGEGYGGHFVVSNDSQGKRITDE